MESMEYGGEKGRGREWVGGGRRGGEGEGGRARSGSTKGKRGGRESGWEGRRGEYYHTVQVAEGSSKKSSMPDVTIS